MPASREYRVRLDAFEGPLDLLLFLIRREEVDITDIPIARITDQYIEQLDELDTIDVDRAGEFLVMAATLMEIKSRMLAPRKEGEGEVASSDGDAPEGQSADDMRADLVRQLLEYKRYRDAAEGLERRMREWEDRYPVIAPVERGLIREAAERAAEIELEDADLMDLIEAFARIIGTVDFDRLGQHTVVVDDTPIELLEQDIVDRLRAEAGPDGEAEFSVIFSGRDRAELIGLFLAMLELVRQRKILVRQDREAGSILLRLREGDEDEAAPEPSDSQEGAPRD